MLCTHRSLLWSIYECDTKNFLSKSTYHKLLKWSAFAFQLKNLSGVFESKKRIDSFADFRLKVLSANAHILYPKADYRGTQSDSESDAEPEVNADDEEKDVMRFTESAGNEEDETVADEELFTVDATPAKMSYLSSKKRHFSEMTSVGRKQRERPFKRRKLSKH